MSDFFSTYPIDHNTTSASAVRLVSGGRVRSFSLEDQALGPIQNPIEMGNTLEAMLATLGQISGYAPYFTEAFGSDVITADRVARAIADYERTLMSGNSAWDQWKVGRDETAVSDLVKQGDELFFGKAGCNKCHLGQNLTDSRFHNLGIGWDPETRTFADEGRYVVSQEEADRGAFKTPTVRDVSKHAPYMHDGSLATLRDVVKHYDKEGVPNPYLDLKLDTLNLTEGEIDALVVFMEALDGEGYQDVSPALFPE